MFRPVSIVLKLHALKCVEGSGWSLTVTFGSKSFKVVPEEGVVTNAAFFRGVAIELPYSTRGSICFTVHKNNENYAFGYFDLQELVGSTKRVVEKTIVLMSVRRANALQNSSSEIRKRKNVSTNLKKSDTKIKLLFSLSTLPIPNDDISATIESVWGIPKIDTNLSTDNPAPLFGVPNSNISGASIWSRMVNDSLFGVPKLQKKFSSKCGDSDLYFHNPQTDSFHTNTLKNSSINTNLNLEVNFDQDENKLFLKNKKKVDDPPCLSDKDDNNYYSNQREYSQNKSTFSKDTDNLGFNKIEFAIADKLCNNDSIQCNEKQISNISQSISIYNQGLKVSAETDSKNLIQLYDSVSNKQKDSIDVIINNNHSSRKKVLGKQSNFNIVKNDNKKINQSSLNTCCTSKLDNLKRTVNIVGDALTQTNGEKFSYIDTHGSADQMNDVNQLKSSGSRRSVRQKLKNSFTVNSIRSLFRIKDK